MSTATLMERITGRRRAAEQASIDTYQQLVVAVADDAESIDPARADAILLDAAKRPDQLAADVAALRQRRVDAEIAAKLPALRQRAEELATACRPLRDALAEAQEKYRREAIELDRQMRFNERDIAEAEAAAARLRAGRPDPRQAELQAEKHRLGMRRDQLSSELGDTATGLRGRLSNLRLALKHGAQPHGGEWPGPFAPSIVPGLAYDENMLRQGIDAVEAPIREAEGELSKVENRLAEVNAELATIERRQLSAE